MLCEIAKRDELCPGCGINTPTCLINNQFLCSTCGLTVLHEEQRIFNRNTKMILDEPLRRDLEH